MNDVLRVSSHDELIAFVPHALGFAPQGMVCLAIGGGPIARVDIPELHEDLDGFIDVLTEVYLHLISRVRSRWWRTAMTSRPATGR